MAFHRHRHPPEGSHHGHPSVARTIDFSAMAETYDHGISGKAIRHIHKILVRTISGTLHPGVRLLDVGCGTGRLLAELEERFGVTGLGVDPSAEMVRVARTACPNMDIRVGTCAELPWESQSVDVVIASLAYHHFDDRTGFVTEATRVLRPSGWIYVLEPCLPAPIRAVVNAFFRLRGHSEHISSTPELIRELTGPHFETRLVRKRSHVQVIASCALWPTLGR